MYIIYTYIPTNLSNNDLCKTFILACLFIMNLVLIMIMNCMLFKLFSSPNEIVVHSFLICIQREYSFTIG